MKSLRSTGRSVPARARGQVGRRAAEELAVGEDGERSRTAVLVGARQLLRVQVGLERALRRRAALDLGDDGQPAEPARGSQRRAEAPRGRGRRGLLRRADQRRERAGIGRRPLAVGPQDAVQVGGHCGHCTDAARGGRSDRGRPCHHEAVAPDQTVVVVEDDPAIADLLDLYLRQAGYRVLQAPTGERGLELVAQHRPVLVVLDIGLPGIDGLEVCRRIRVGSTLAHPLPDRARRRDRPRPRASSSAPTTT